MIGAYLEVLLEAFDSCLREGRFFADWKKQRFVLLRKGNKPLGVASSYRPICLLDTMGKLLEELILQRLQALLVGENGLSENQFGFRNGRYTLDAIQAVVNIATNARKGTGKRNRFCALISIDIRNAFNTARWNICIEALMRKKVPDYLLRMIDDYLTSAVLVLASVPTIYLLAEERQETFQLRKEITCADLQEIARAKEAIRKDGRRRLVGKWQMRWHGEQTGR